MATDKVLSELTPRQTLCLQLVADGLTSKQIGRKLDISHRTVDQHVAAAVDALGAPNRTAASNMFLQKDTPAAGTNSQLTPSPAPDPKQHIGLPSPPTEESARPLIGNRHTPLIPPLGGMENVAERRTRLGWIAAIAGTILGGGALAYMSVIAVMALG